MAEISSSEDFRAWLKGKPREVAAVLAARSALRILPVWRVIIPEIDASARAAILLPTFAASAFCLIVSILSLRNAVDMRGFTKHLFRFDAITRKLSKYMYQNYEENYTPHGSARPDAMLFHSLANAQNSLARASFDDKSLLNSIDLTTEVGGYIYLGFPSHSQAVSDMSGDPELHTWAALSADCTFLDAARKDDLPARAEALAAMPLWPSARWEEAKWSEGRWGGGTPGWALENWQSLRRSLNAVRGEHWVVWTRWYQDRLDGKPYDKALEEDRVLIPEGLWEQGPAAVNAELQRVIDRHKGKAGTGRKKPPKPPALPEDRPSPVQFVFRGEVLDVATPDAPEVADAREAMLESARRALSELMADSGAGPVSDAIPRLVGTLDRCRTALGSSLATLDVLALGVHGDPLREMAARADSMLSEDKAAQLVALNAQLQLFLAQFEEWADYRRALEPPFASEETEQEAVRNASLALDRIEEAAPGLLSDAAVAELETLRAEATPVPGPDTEDAVAAPLPRRSFLRAMRNLVLRMGEGLRKATEDGITEGWKIWVRTTVVVGLSAGATWLLALAAGLPVEFAWVSGLVAWVRQVFGAGT